MNDNIIASFSGGKTSAYMTYLLKKEYGDKLKVVFMNTGLEHEETLKFVEKCDKAWGLNTVWLEAKVVHEAGKGTTYSITDYKNAHRGNSIAKEVVRKYGLFGYGFLHCTREMKLQPFKKWKKDIGLENAKTAIGIRSDEIDRMNSNFEKEKLFYPLIRLGVTKKEVRAFWDVQRFNLDIKEREGNCVMCWKKSNKKLLANANEYQDHLKMIKELENMTKKGSDFMFRGRRKSNDLVSMQDLNNKSNGCEESCEVF